MAQRPSLVDVARLAGVSTATVSRALNEPALLRFETRERVEQAIKSLGYTPHFAGRALASNRSDTVGAVIPTMANAIFARGLQALQEELASAGVTLLVGTSNYDPEEEHRQIRTLLTRGVDGMILIGEARDPAIYDVLNRRSVPFVLLWSWREDCPWTCVGFDNDAAAREVARRMLDLGHRRIGMIAGVTNGNDRALARVRGVQVALAVHGAPLDDALLTEAAYSFDAGAEAAARLLAQTPRPTALICGNDVLAAGALKAARTAGLRVPEDLSITGFDDIDIATLTEPALATVHVPHLRMGRIGAQLLLSQRQPNQRMDSVRIDSEFMARGSLGPAPGA